MNWKQRIVKKYIAENFAVGSVSISVDSPESLRATDALGESLVFWLDDATGRIMDEYSSPAAYEKWRKTGTAHSISVDVKVDTTEATEKIEALTAKASALESTMLSIVEAIDTATEKAGNGHLTYNEVRAILGAPPLPNKEPPQRAAPDFGATLADFDVLNNCEPSSDSGDPFTYDPGFSDGSVVFCPDCGHAVQSGYNAFTSSAAADQYAREHCPICTARNTAEADRQHENELARRVAFVKELESIVRKAEPTVQSIEHQRPGMIDGECLIIHYASTETCVPISADSLLAIAKSVMEALPY